MAKKRGMESLPKMRGMVDRSEKKDLPMKIWSSARKSLHLPSHTQAVTNDLENVFEGGAYYKPQTNCSI